MDFDSFCLKPLNEYAVSIITEWAYEQPYHVYDFKGHSNGYLKDRHTWGTEQFYLTDGEQVIAQVACQFDGDDLWVGWSLSPSLCGNGNGHQFIKTCIRELRRIKGYDGDLYLRVAAWNQRAIKVYQKAGFRYNGTIEDEIPYSDCLEPFWIMKTDSL